MSASRKTITLTEWLEGDFPEGLYVVRREQKRPCVGWLQRGSRLLDDLQGVVVVFDPELGPLCDGCPEF